MSKFVFRISVAVLLTTMVVLFFTIGAISPEFQAQQAKQQAEQATKSTPTPMPVVAARPTPVVQGDEQTLRSMCAERWPRDFEMRAYCEKQQRGGLRDLANASVPAITRQMCAERWSRDFEMRAYCERQQVKALRELQQDNVR
jgi:hypothetical protein